jgi:hypothetical protein
MWNTYLNDKYKPYSIHRRYGFFLRAHNTDIISIEYPIRKREYEIKRRESTFRKTKITYRRKNIIVSDINIKVKKRDIRLKKIKNIHIFVGVDMNQWLKFDK